MPARHNVVFRHKKRNSTTSRATSKLPTSSPAAAAHHGSGVAVGSVPASLFPGNDLHAAAHTSKKTTRQEDEHQATAAAAAAAAATNSIALASFTPPPAPLPRPPIANHATSRPIPMPPTSRRRFLHVYRPSPPFVFDPTAFAPRPRAQVSTGEPSLAQAYLPRPTPNALPPLQDSVPDPAEHGTGVVSGGFGEPEPPREMSSREREEEIEMRKRRSHEEFLAALEEIRGEVAGIRKREEEKEGKGV